jgi:hypothetical protein
MVNSTHYKAGSAALIPSGTSSVSATATNFTKGPQIGTLTWRLYAWDAARADAPLDEQKVDVKLHPGMSADYTYALSDITAAAYYLEGEIDTGTGHSFISVMLERSGETGARISALTLDHYPPTGDSRAFMCLRTIGANLERRVEVEAKGTAVFARGSFSGPIPSAGIAIPLTLATSGPESDFDLTARLFRGTTLEDTLSLHYDCKALGTPCPQRLSSVPSAIMSIGGLLWNLGIGLALILGVVGIVFAYMRIHKKAEGPGLLP